MTTSPSTTVYEIMALIPGSLKPSAQKAALEHLDAEVAKLGQIDKQTLWENRPLAYRIGTDTHGTYAIYLVHAAPAKIPEFNQVLRLDPQIMRHMIVKTPKDYVWKDYTAEDLEWDYEKVLAKEAASRPPRPAMGNMNNNGPRRMGSTDRPRNPRA